MEKVWAIFCQEMIHKKKNMPAWQILDVCDI